MIVLDFAYWIVDIYRMDDRLQRDDGWQQGWDVDKYCQMKDDIGYR